MFECDAVTSGRAALTGARHPVTDRCHGRGGVSDPLAAGCTTSFGDRPPMNGAWSVLPGALSQPAGVPGRVPEDYALMFEVRRLLAAKCGGLPALLRRLRAELRAMDSAWNRLTGVPGPATVATGSLAAVTTSVVSTPRRVTDECGALTSGCGVLLETKSNAIAR